MIYGRPTSIPAQKANLYFTYVPSMMKDQVAHVSDGELRYDIKDDGSVEGEQILRNMELIIQEFNVVKQVLLNNSIPVDMSEV